MYSPDIKIGCVSNVYCRMMHFVNKGDIEMGHSHPFDHLSLLANGSVEVTIDSITTTFKAPHMIFIKKDKEHEIKALEDNSLIYCIHALRDGFGVGDIIDPDSIPKGIEVLEDVNPVTHYRE